MQRALDGIRVLDLSHVVAGPYCTMMLADLGAEVIRVEPPEGEDMRSYQPFFGEPGKSRAATYIRLNRNKKSVVLNLHTNEGKEVLRDLVAKADVLVENFRPDTMEKLGFGWPELQEMNPGLVYASISGFGHDCLPEYASLAAYDMVAQAYSGLMSLTGPSDAHGYFVGAFIADIVAGHQAAFSILAALRHSDRTGRGQHIDCSMVDSLFSVISATDVYLAWGMAMPPLGNENPVLFPFQSFDTADSAVVICCPTTNLWTRLCDALERDDLGQDERFRNNSGRVQHKEHLLNELRATFRSRPTADWCDRFREAHIPFSPVNDIGQAVEDANIKYRRMIVDMDQPTCSMIRTVGSSLFMSETPGEVYAHAPLLGEHSDEVLSGILGYSSTRLENLKAARVTNTEIL